MSEWAIHPEHTDFWSRAVAAKYEDGPKIPKKEWDSILSSYQSGADIPFSEFSFELLEIYPNTKVILTNKSPDALWKSWSKAATFSQHPPWYLTALNFLLDPFSRSAESRRRAVMHRLLKNKFGGKPLDEQTVKRVFQEHYDHVRSLVPKESLLEYRIEEGWEPLCEFLGEDVPEGEEFPRGNSSEDFQNAVRLIWKIQTVFNLGRGLLVVGGVWVSWRYLVRAGLSWEWLKGVVSVYS
ncbi:hypothetical protein ZTR_10997 [Talaromyces verruculosus]|nr:hypothetical protein ZTR_10997 [Talaromyces verruculosus]